MASRYKQRASVASNNWTWKIKGSASHGSYDSPVQWTMTAQNVVENDIDSYLESVRM